MVVVEIRGIGVMFPFQPYDCQVAYMNKVIEAIEMKFDAALESPTGTGKTLSLLCSTLAWLQKQKLLLQATFQSAASQVASGSTLSLSTFLPRIYYCSRTHSQLAQVVRELNRTMYKDIRVSVLGSRDQLCVHSKVCKEADNRVKTALCRNMVSKRSCQYYNNWDSAALEDLDAIFSVKGQVPDIEDIVSIGKRHVICPFYRCRQMQETAELLLLPYNYIIDPNLRRTHRIDLSGSIVIFDEAHNLEGVCESAVSGEFSSTNLSLAIEELKDAIKCQREEAAAARTELDNSSQAFGTGSVKDERQSKGPAFNIDEAAILLKILFELEKRIEDVYSDETGFNLADLPGKVFPGDRLPKMFDEAGISFDKVESLLLLITKIVDYLQMEIDLKRSFIERGKNLETLRDLFSIVYTSLSKEAALSISRKKPVQCDIKSTKIDMDVKRVGEHFKLYVVKEEGTANKPSCTLIKFWCFTAAIAMRSLKMNGVRTVIVTSGTLSPLADFTKNIGLEFGCILENNHAAKGDQVLAAIVRKSPFSGCVLNGSYVERQKDSYAQGIAESLLQIAATVPEGMLVFFASYALMNRMISSFKEMKCKDGSRCYWDCMMEEKLIVIEPKQKAMLSSSRSEFAQAVRSGRGAMFFAVCRGKVSEGIDFSDADSRAVCVVGIPFPPTMEARVCLKRLYMNNTGYFNKNTQSSEEWYVTEGYRAVNQAIGRVIRHVNDFGVVVLLDERFATVRREYFPTWLRGSLKIFDDGSRMIKAVEKFFDEGNAGVGRNEKKGGVSCLRHITKDGNRPVAFSKKRIGLPVSQAVGKRCVFDYDLYSEKPAFMGKRSSGNQSVANCHILYLCNDEASRENCSTPQTVHDMDVATSSGVSVIPQPARKKLKMVRCPSRRADANEALQRTPQLPHKYEQVTSISPKQYFEHLIQINKHKEVAALMKQFSSGLKSFIVVLEELEQTLLPNFPRAFLGSYCILEKPEEKQLLIERSVYLKLKP